MLCTVYVYQRVLISVVIPLSRYSLGNKFNSDPDMKHYTDNRKREQNDSSENV